MGSFNVFQKAKTKQAMMNANAMIIDTIKLERKSQVNTDQARNDADTWTNIEPIFKTEAMDMDMLKHERENHSIVIKTEVEEEMQVNFSTQAPMPPTTLPSSPPPPYESSPMVFRACRVRCDFTAKTPTKLSVDEGELLLILYKDPSGKFNLFDNPQYILTYFRLLAC